MVALEAHSRRLVDETGPVPVTPTERARHGTPSGTTGHATPRTWSFQSTVPKRGRKRRYLPYSTTAARHNNRGLQRRRTKFAHRVRTRRARGGRYAAAMAITFSVVAIDCPDPVALAEFYSRLTGRPVEPLDRPAEDVTWIELVDEGRPTIAFQRVAPREGPTWPEGPVPSAAHRLFGRRPRRGRGATRSRSARRRPTINPATTFRVFLDPSGIPSASSSPAPRSTEPFRSHRATRD